MHFKDYANYYNLLYKDKDYKAEADYVHALIKQFAPHSKTLIDLGCGTGNHAFEFERLGYEVTGVDLSSQMVAIANDNKEKNNSSILFSEGDIRTFRDTKKYDVVVSLFHVMSYQTSNDDLEKAFHTAKTLMVADGVFIFDCWYGPGVLNDLPTSRMKDYENESLKITRISHSTIDFSSNVVVVIFDVVIENKITKEVTKLSEKHPMRYLFNSEIEEAASKHQFDILGQLNWMTDEKASENSWYTVFVIS